MAIDLIQWMVFCSCRCGRAACATSSAVHGSVGLLPTFRNREPVLAERSRRQLDPVTGPLQIA